LPSRVFPSSDDGKPGRASAAGKAELNGSANSASGNNVAVVTRWMGIFAWSLTAWMLLTWSRNPEQIAFGVGVAAIVATLALRLGPYAVPWRLLEPRRCGSAPAWWWFRRS
jgi:hypothetical protein